MSNQEIKKQTYLMNRAGFCLGGWKAEDAPLPAMTETEAEHMVLSGTIRLEGTKNPLKAEPEAEAAAPKTTAKKGN